MLTSTFDKVSPHHLSPRVVPLHTRGRLVPEPVHPEDDGWNSWVAHNFSFLRVLYLETTIGGVLVERDSQLARQPPTCEGRQDSLYPQWWKLPHHLTSVYGGERFIY